MLATQVDLTSKDSMFVPVSEVPAGDRYFEYQAKVNGDWVPSEVVIEEHIQQFGEEYRSETDGPSPVPGLRPEARGGGEAIAYERRSQQSH